MPKHIAILKALLKDFLLGENILLIGNQGVGYFNISSMRW
jgi:hypothetical protein